MIRKWETRDAAFLPNDLENAISQPTVSVKERFLSIVIIGSTPVLLPSTLNYTSTVWHKRSCLSWWKPPHDIALSCTARTNFLLAKMLFTRTQNCSTEIRKQLWHIFRNFLLFHTLHTRLNFLKKWFTSSCLLQGGHFFNVHYLHQTVNTTRRSQPLIVVMIL